MRVRVVRIERERLAIENFLFVEPALRAERSAQAHEVRRIRLERDRAPVMRFGARIVAEPADQAAQIDVRLRVIRRAARAPARNWRSPRRGRLARCCALPALKCASADVRVEREHVAIARQRFVETAELAQRRAEIQMRVDQRGVRRQREPVLFDRFVQRRLAPAARRRSCCARRRNPAVAAAPGRSRSSLRRDGRARRPRVRGCSSRRHR